MKKAAFSLNKRKSLELRHTSSAICDSLRKRRLEMQTPVQRRKSFENTVPRVSAESGGLGLCPRCSEAVPVPHRRITAGRARMTPKSCAGIRQNVHDFARLSLSLSLELLKVVSYENTTIVGLISRTTWALFHHVHPPQVEAGSPTPRRGG